jgi:hypothetical protein
LNSEIADLKERAVEAAAAAAAVDYCSVAAVGCVSEPFLTAETKTLRSRETMIFMVKNNKVTP